MTAARLMRTEKRNMRKRILIACNNLHIGGIQRSLANLLGEVSDRYDVTLFLFYPEGEYSVPKNVKIIRGNFFTRIMGMTQAEANRAGVPTRLWRGFWTVFTRIFGCGAAFRPLCAFQRIDGEYDAAVSFMQNSAYRFFYGGCNEFVINCVKAKRKISFVHCDFEHYYGNNAYNRNFYKKFDTIACVSGACKDVFDRVCPDYADRSTVVHNCFNFSEMRSMAEEFAAERTGGVTNIFTSARISEEKGIFRTIKIFADLKADGAKFIWRIAGGGAQLEKAVEMCRSYGLENDIIFLGQRENPYPYFKSADLALVPSYDEAAPMVFGEAAAFGTPILSTATISARELVEEKGLGTVCENSDEGIKNALRKILDNPQSLNDDLRKKRVENAEQSANRAAVSEFENAVFGSVT